ncbi:MAG: ATP-binding protein [Peptococcales bacterium]|jgi:two-component system sensor histidine kinase ResE
MIRNSVISKLWLSIVILIVMVLLFLSLGLSSLLEDFYYSRISQELVVEGQRLIEVVNSEDDYDRLVEKLDLLSNFTNAHIIVVDKKGLVEACNSMMGVNSGTHFDVGDLEKVFQGNIVTKRGYHHHFEAPMLSAAIPMHKGKEIDNALLLYRPVAPISETISSMRWLIIYAAIGAILLASVVSFFLSRSLSRPLVQMNKVAREMAKGNFDHKIQVKSEDEVGLLGATLNHMSKQLKNNITELSHEKEKLENILASMSDGVITLDAQGNIILINPPAENLLKKCVHNLKTGEKVFDCLMMSDFKLMFDEVNDEKKIQTKDVEINGKIIAVRMTPLLGDSNSLIGVVGVLQDVTKERELEQMRRDFIANVSHELRTPLSLMQGYSEALLDGMAEDPHKKEKVISIIHQETLRLKRMVDELLDLSRLQTGHFNLNKQNLSIPDILRVIEEKYQPAVLKAGLEFKLEIEQDLPQVYADLDRMQQVLINLVENALKHTDQGYIAIFAFKENNQICIEVTDTGSGIASEDLDFIWERFYKADKSRERAKGGTGLGLAIVQNIIKAHNGKVWVRSEVGTGSTFGFCIPIFPTIPLLKKI